MSEFGPPAGVQNKNNGNGKKYNNPFDFQSIFSQTDLPSMARHFVEPGKTARELFMRTVFRNEAEATNAVLYLAQCEEFGITEGETMLKNYLASRPSVGGRSRKELAMVGTGIMVPSLYGTHERRQRDNETHE